MVQVLIVMFSHWDGINELGPTRGCSYGIFQGGNGYRVGCNANYDKSSVLSLFRFRKSIVGVARMEEALDPPTYSCTVISKVIK